MFIFLGFASVYLTVGWNPAKFTAIQTVLCGSKYRRSFLQQEMPRKYLHSSQLIVLRRAKNLPETVANSTTPKSVDVNAKFEIAELEIKRRDMLVITNYPFKGS